MAVVVLLLLLCLSVQFTEHLSIAQPSNLSKNDCTYKDGRFGHIDLSRVGLKQGVPAFRHVPKDDYLFSYNPCYPFTEDASCMNVAICQVSKDGSAYYNLGYNSLVTWSITADGKATLVYSTVDRQTIVNLQCSDEIDQMVVNGEYELRHYNLTLFSKCACWNGCSG